MLVRALRLLAFFLSGFFLFTFFLFTFFLPALLLAVPLVLAYQAFFLSAVLAIIATILPPLHPLCLCQDQGGPRRLYGRLVVGCAGAGVWPASRGGLPDPTQGCPAGPGKGFATRVADYVMSSSSSRL